MATQSQLKQVANAITGMASAVSNTFAEQARDITRTAKGAWGDANWSIPKAEKAAVIAAVADGSTWKGTSSEKTRLSEVGAIVRAYPFLGTACADFKRDYGELRREHVVKIARECPNVDSASDAAYNACLHFEERDARKPGKGGKKATVEEGLGIIKKVQTTAKHVIAFRKDLAALCKKHGIKY